MKRSLIVFLLLSLVIKLDARVSLPALFTDHMVLQRNKPIIIWGFADAEKQVEVSFAGISKTAFVENGRWLIDFEAKEAGGPFDLIVKSSNTIMVSDILMGDVFICGGQSNMEWPMRDINNSEQELADASYPKIRMFTVLKDISDRKQEDLPSGAWELADSETAAEFSAIGFLTARKLHKMYNVPIGLIDNSWGGTNIMGWMPQEAFGNSTKYLSMIDKFKAEHCGELTYTQALRDFTSRLETSDKGLFEGWSEPDFDKTQWNKIYAPALWEGQGYPDKDGFFWMSKKVELKNVQDEKPCVLSLTKIDDADITYFNGLIVGTTDSYSAMRKYEFHSDHLLEGSNEITIRIKDTGGGGGVYGLPSDMYLKCEGMDSVPLHGMWSIAEGSAQLEPISSTYEANANPTNRYNPMVHPLTNYPVAAYLYYQGESDAWQAKEYEWLFQNMIRSYRTAWQDNSMPFVFVQLANFMAEDSLPVESQWADLRAAQAAALKLPYTAMVSAIDIGVADDIHPRDKQTVATRTVECLRRLLYGEQVIFDGPKIERVVTNSFGTLVVFKGTGEGLAIKGDDQNINGFVIETMEGTLVKIKAKKQSRTALLLEYYKPFKTLRYLWANNPGTVQIYNEAGFPAEPFKISP